MGHLLQETEFPDSGAQEGLCRENLCSSLGKGGIECPDTVFALLLPKQAERHITGDRREQGQEASPTVRWRPPSCPLITHQSKCSSLSDQPGGDRSERNRAVHNDSTWSRKKRLASPLEGQVQGVSAGIPAHKLHVLLFSRCQAGAAPKAKLLSICSQGNKGIL